MPAPFADLRLAGPYPMTDAIPWRARVPSPESQRETKEEALLECAATWFHRHGFHGASLSDIAGDLGLSKAALYRYARNKQELLYTLHLRSLHAARDARDQAVAEGRDGADRLARLVYNFVRAMTTSITRTFILLEPGTLAPDQARTVTDARRWLEYDMRELVSQGVADGSIAVCDPKVVVMFIVGAQNWIVSWYQAGGSWTGEQVAQAYSAMVRRLISTEPDLPLPCMPTTAS